MKNKSIISTLFGLLIILGLSLQLMNDSINKSATDFSIELSDYNDEIEEEENSLEEATQIIVRIYKIIVFKKQVSKHSRHNLFHTQTVRIQIPSPPPELT